MSTQPPTATETETDAPDPTEAEEVKGIGLAGTVSLGTDSASLGGGAAPGNRQGDHGIQRPPSLSGEDMDLPKVTAPPFASNRVEMPPEVREPTQVPVAVGDGDEPLEDEDGAQGEDATRPPSSTLRFPTPSELYSGFPEVKALTLHRPRESETVADYLERLRGSTTPEEAITFTAFAAQPAMSIWWAYGCLRSMADSLSPEDRGLMEMIAMWSGNPDNANRWRVMKAGLYAPKLTPVGYLALAVGWSGGTIAPNDPAPVPPWRTPKAINTAVLSSVAHVSLQERSRSLARFIDLAGKMFEVY